MNLTEMNVSLTNPPENLLNEPSVYNPVIERHLRQRLSTGDYTLRAIKKGEEILCNYLAFGDPDDWEEEVLGLRTMCAGKAGEVSAYELEHAKELSIYN